MEPFLNYHHLRYFWAVAREGSVTGAARRLHAAPPTVSTQVKALEHALGERLVERSGRRLVLTEMGRSVFGYAEDIFALGTELVETVAGRSGGRRPRFVVGIADAVPKIVAYEVLEAARHLGAPLAIVCREGAPDRLLAALASHELDLVLSDAPAPAGGATRAYSHLLGECGVTWFAVPRLAARLRRGFPGSLNGQPVVLPGETSALRRALDSWFEAEQLHTVLAAECDDPALLKVFGQAGVGVFPAPSAVEAAIRRQYRVAVIGRTEAVKERFWAISVERRLKHPAVTAIVTAARTRLFR